MVEGEIIFSFKILYSVKYFFVGCVFGELGIKTPNERRVPDRYMTSSSERDSSHAAHRARIGIEAIGTWEDGWCSSASDPNPYIQVFFGTFRQKIILLIS